MNLLIHNVTLFTNNDRNAVLTDNAVAVQDGRIADIGRVSRLQKRYPDYRAIDGNGRLLMPGLVNAHMHFYSTFARGLALGGEPQSFAEILSMLWWRLDRSLDLEAVYYSALIPALTAVKNGVTAVIDHHASAGAVDGSLDQIEAALATVGLRGVLCYELSDRDGKEIAQQGLRENERYLKKCHLAREKDPDFMFDALIGLHASFTLEPDTLERVSDLVRTLKKGCHIHLAEDGVDVTQTREKFGDNLVERLQKFDILGEQTIAAHCIHLSETAKDRLAETLAMVAHTPQSNMNNAVGRTDIFGFLERDMLVGLGTDGMSPDLKPDIRTALLLHKHDLQDFNRGWAEIRQLALKNNPLIFERVSGQKVGRIEAGYRADLILVDYFPPTPLTADNFWGHFLFGIADATVDTTIIEGRIVMKDKQLQIDLDEAAVAAEARRVAEQVWKRFRR